MCFLPCFLLLQDIGRCATSYDSKSTDALNVYVLLHKAPCGSTRSVVRLIEGASPQSDLGVLCREAAARTEHPNRP